MLENLKVPLSSKASVSLLVVRRRSSHDVVLIASDQVCCELGEARSTGTFTLATLKVCVESGGQVRVD
jgi:hypothetical protein